VPEQNPSVARFLKKQAGLLKALVRALSTGDHAALDLRWNLLAQAHLVNSPEVYDKLWAGLRQPLVRSSAVFPFSTWRDLVWETYLVCRRADREEVATAFTQASPATIEAVLSFVDRGERGRRLRREEYYRLGERIFYVDHVNYDEDKVMVREMHTGLPLWFSTGLFLEHARPQKAADALRRDSLRPQRLAWRLLPPGQLERIFAGTKRRGPRTAEVKQREERLRKIESLRPTRAYVGADSFAGYHAFIFDQYRPPLAILESEWFGNAIYVFFSHWEELSRLTKAEVREYEGVHRIVHADGWQGRLKKLLSSRRSRKKLVKGPAGRRRRRK
jgi:hypothetical protein